MDVDVETYETAGVLVVRLQGDMDGYTAPLIEEQIQPYIAEQQRVLLDMQHVHYLSSAGLRLLLILYRQITGRGGQVALTGLSDLIADTMNNTGFLDFFASYDTLEAGLLALQSD
jgi:anti-sigma B factor antagonist